MQSWAQTYNVLVSPHRYFMTRSHVEWCRTLLCINYYGRKCEKQKTRHKNEENWPNSGLLIVENYSMNRECVNRMIFATFYALTVNYSMKSSCLGYSSNWKTGHYTFQLHCHYPSSLNYVQSCSQIVLIKAVGTSWDWRNEISSKYFYEGSISSAPTSRSRLSSLRKFVPKELIFWHLPRCHPDIFPNIYQQARDIALTITITFNFDVPQSRMSMVNFNKFRNELFIQFLIRHHDTFSTTSRNRLMRFKAVDVSWD